MGPLVLLIWWDEGLSCWWPPQEPLGIAGLRREPMEESRAEHGEGQSWWQPLEGWIQLSLQPDLARSGLLSHVINSLAQEWPHNLQPSAK